GVSTLLTRADLAYPPLDVGCQAPAFPMCRVTAVAPRAPPQGLNSVQTSAGPVKVDRKSKNATMQSIGVSRSPSLSEGAVRASILRSSAGIPGGNGRWTTTPRGLVSPADEYSTCSLRRWLSKRTTFL